MAIQPLSDRVVLKRVDPAETVKGGIIIPDSAKEKPTEGVVRALGTGKTDDSGKKLPFEVKVGDRVLVSKYGGTEIKIEGKEYKLLGSDDLLAVLN
jgi:chaperonin GroES